MNVDQLNNALLLVNKTLQRYEIYLSLYITGGSAVLFHINDNEYFDFRETQDIDYVNVLYSTDLRDMLEDFSIEFAGMFNDSVPSEDYIEQSELYSFSHRLSHLDVYIPPLEIICTNKIMSTRQKDLDDCLILLQHVDIDNVESRVKELLTYQAYHNPDMNLFALQRRGYLKSIAI